MIINPLEFDSLSSSKFHFYLWSFWGYLLAGKTKYFCGDKKRGTIETISARTSIPSLLQSISQIGIYKLISAGWRQAWPGIVNSEYHLFIFSYQNRARQLPCSCDGKLSLKIEKIFSHKMLKQFILTLWRLNWRTFLSWLLTVSKIELGNIMLNTPAVF